MATQLFDHARDFSIEHFQVFDGHSSSTSPLERLEACIAPEALDDSAERCDAPKCHPETRVAVQDDLYAWIQHGDATDPKNIKWVTGPAGTGKTAVMGSITARCKENGVPVASFFFSSRGSSGCSTKTAFVTTIAHQLSQHRQDLKDAIATAIEVDTVVFKKNLRVQMETLILAPLRAVSRDSNAVLGGVIVIDGLDECQAEVVHSGGASIASGHRSKPARSKEEDQLEILQVLQQASSDPSFPYRILIASRPERVFREFFDAENNPTSLAEKLDLNVEYNANADIFLFLKAQFNLIRRRYRYPSSWPSEGTIEKLVRNASGQFIYAATIIRVLDHMHHRDPPKALLDTILKVKAPTTDSNPLEQLDALYTDILESSPDPHLSILWIRSIQLLNYSGEAFAADVDLLLQMDPESNEAEHFLGNLHSLIRIPPPENYATTTYGFYHKSLLDLLEDSKRCGSLHVEWDEVYNFIWDRFFHMCMRGHDVKFSSPETFLRALVHVPDCKTICFGEQDPEMTPMPTPTPASADWWVSLVMTHKADRVLWYLFQKVHSKCIWYWGCNLACTIWSRSILRRLGSARVAWQYRDDAEKARFMDLVEQARRGIEDTGSGAGQTESSAISRSHSTETTASRAAARTAAKPSASSSAEKMVEGTAEPSAPPKRVEKAASGGSGAASKGKGTSGNKGPGPTGVSPPPSTSSKGKGTGKGESVAGAATTSSTGSKSKVANGSSTRANSSKGTSATNTAPVTAKNPTNPSKKGGTGKTDLGTTGTEVTNSPTSAVTGPSSPSKRQGETTSSGPVEKSSTSSGSRAGKTAAQDADLSTLSLFSQPERGAEKKAPRGRGSAVKPSPSSNNNVSGKTSVSGATGAGSPPSTPSMGDGPSNTAPETTKTAAGPSGYPKRSSRGKAENRATGSDVSKSSISLSSEVAATERSDPSNRQGKEPTAMGAACTAEEPSASSGAKKAAGGTVVKSSSSLSKSNTADKTAVSGITGAQKKASGVSRTSAQTPKRRSTGQMEWERVGADVKSSNSSSNPERHLKAPVDKKASSMLRRSWDPSALYGYQM
ncbi:hypothetical protein MD484_g5248, partial [Candolleomyces efflorescens]